MIKSKTIKKALIEQKKIELPGNLYYKTQIEFCYNSNHIEGSTITPDETMSIYDTGTILTNNQKVVSLKDMTETKNHFSVFKFMLDTLEQELSEELIKFYIEARNKPFYVRGLKEYQTNNEKSYLIDTCIEEYIH